MADELRNQLKSQNINTLTADSIASVGGEVFPDVPAAQDLNDFDQIVNAWQQVHVPTYGNPIPGSGAKVDVSQTGGVGFGAGDGEVYKINAASVANIGEDAQTIDIKLGTALNQSVTLINQLSIAGASTQPIAALNNIILDKNIKVFISTLGDPFELDFKIVYYKLVQ